MRRDASRLKRGCVGVVAFALLWGAASTAQAASSTLVISEVQATPSPEWIEIHNVSSSAVLLDGYKVTDEEGEDASSERVFAFPSGASIPAGGVITVGESASPLADTSVCPTFSWSGGSGVTCVATQAMAATPTFTFGSPTNQLVNAGDQVLLLDATDSVVDSVAYGTSTWSVFTPTVPAAPAGSSIERYPRNQDTDSASDWRVQPIRTPNGFTRTLSVSRSGSGAGAVTSSPSGIACSEPAPDCSEVYGSAQVVTLAAQASGKSTFVGWTGCDSLQPGVNGDDCVVTTDDDQNVTAAFAPPSVVTVTRLGAGGGSVTGPGIDCPGDCSEEYLMGADVTLSAAPATGSTFVGWNGCQFIVATQCTVEADADRGVTAEFFAPPTTVTDPGTTPDPGTTTPTGNQTPTGSATQQPQVSGGVEPDAVETLLAKATVKGRRRTATFVFSGSGGVGALAFECKLDKRAFAPCASPKRYRRLKRGRHTFQVRAKDSRGALDTTPAGKAFRITRAGRRSAS